MTKLKCVVLILCVFAACKSEKEKLTETISKTEKELIDDSSQQVNRKKAEEMIGLYKEYAARFADDTVSAEYLFRAGDISNGIGQYKEAIEYYGRSSENEKFSKHAVAFFLMGFIYETQLNDMVNSKRIYEEFLRKYPDHPLTSDVKFSLDNLGKSPEELIKMFEKNDSIPAPGDSLKAAS